MLFTAGIQTVLVALIASNTAAAVPIDVRQEVAPHIDVKQDSTPSKPSNGFTGGSGAVPPPSARTVQIRNVAALFINKSQKNGFVIGTIPPEKSKRQDEESANFNRGSPGNSRVDTKRQEDSEARGKSRISPGDLPGNSKRQNFSPGVGNFQPGPDVPRTSKRQKDFGPGAGSGGSRISPGDLPGNSKRQNFSPGVGNFQPGPGVSGTSKKRQNAGPGTPTPGQSGDLFPSSKRQSGSTPAIGNPGDGKPGNSSGRTVSRRKREAHSQRPGNGSGGNLIIPVPGTKREAQQKGKVTDGELGKAQGPAQSKREAQQNAKSSQEGSGAQRPSLDSKREAQDNEGSGFTRVPINQIWGGINI